MENLKILKVVLPVRVRVRVVAWTAAHPRKCCTRSPNLLLLLLLVHSCGPERAQHDGKMHNLTPLVPPEATSACA